MAERDLSTLFECDTRVSLAVVPMHKVKAREAATAQGRRGRKVQRILQPHEVTNIHELSRSANKDVEPEYY